MLRRRHIDDPRVERSVWATSLLPSHPRRRSVFSAFDESASATRQPLCPLPRTFRESAATRPTLRIPVVLKTACMLLGQHYCRNVTSFVNVGDTMPLITLTAVSVCEAFILRFLYGIWRAREVRAAAAIHHRHPAGATARAIASTAQSASSAYHANVAAVAHSRQGASLDALPS